MIGGAASVLHMSVQVSVRFSGGLVKLNVDGQSVGLLASVPLRIIGSQQQPGWALA
jgi:hypothetical protein